MTDEKTEVTPKTENTPAAKIVENFPLEKVVALEKEIAELRKTQTDGQSRLDGIGNELRQFMAGKVTQSPTEPTARISFLQDCLNEFDDFWFGSGKA